MSSNTTTPKVYTPIEAIEQLQENLNTVTERMHKTAKTSTDTSTSNIEFLVLRAIESIEGMDGTADRILSNVLSHKRNITNEFTYKVGDLVRINPTHAIETMESLKQMHEAFNTSALDLCHTISTTTQKNVSKVLYLTLQAIASIERMHHTTVIPTTTATASDVLVRTTLRTIEAIERMTNTANRLAEHGIHTIHDTTSVSSSTITATALNDDPRSSRKRPRFDDDRDDIDYDCDVYSVYEPEYN